MRNLKYRFRHDRKQYDQGEGARFLRVSVCFEDVTWLCFGWLEIFNLFVDRKSVILGVWAAAGAPEILAKGGGRSPPPFGKVSGAPGAAQNPKMNDVRPLQNLQFRIKVQPRRCEIKAKTRANEAQSEAIRRSGGPRSPALAKRIKKAAQQTLLAVPSFQLNSKGPEIF